MAGTFPQCSREQTPRDALTDIGAKASDLFDSCFPHVRAMRMMAVAGDGGAEAAPDDPGARLSSDLIALGKTKGSKRVIDVARILIEAAEDVGGCAGTAATEAAITMLAHHQALVEQARNIGQALAAARESAGGRVSGAQMTMAKARLRRATDLPISRLMAVLQLRDSISQRVEHMVAAFDLTCRTDAAATGLARVQAAQIGSLADTLREASETGATATEGLIEAMAAGQAGEHGLAVGHASALARHRDDLVNAATDSLRGLDGAAPLVDPAASLRHAVDDFVAGPVACLLARCACPDHAPSLPARRCLQIAQSAEALQATLARLCPLADALDALASDIDQPERGLQKDGPVEAVLADVAGLYTVDIEHEVHKALLQRA